MDDRVPVDDRVPLSERMATAARDLQDEHDPQLTLELAVKLAVQNVRGADAASVSIVHARRRIDTAAATDDMVVRGDQLQYEIGEGPCLDAIWQHATVYSPSLAYDPRWPVWGPRVVEETNAQSVLAFQLFTVGETLGALNLYSRTKDAFDDTDRQDGEALAAHVAIAIAAVSRIDSLSNALDNRTLIGIAVGLVMERYGLDESRAFSLLTRLSTTSNTKVRDLAREIVDTRVIPARHQGAERRS